jgi:hypothetical protein
LYSSPDTIRMITSRDEMGRACNTHGEKRNAYGYFVGKPVRKRPLSRKCM